jgi:hypothetical protein
LSARTVNLVFLVSSNENPTTAEIAQRVAAAIGIPYRPVPLPRWGARLFGRLLGPRWQTPALPHRLQIAAWRARLLFDGLHCDGTPLAQLLGLKFQDWRAGIVRMYAEDPPRSSKAGPPSDQAPANRSQREGA